MDEQILFSCTYTCGVLQRRFVEIIIYKPLIQLYFDEVEIPRGFDLIVGESDVSIFPAGSTQNGGGDNDDTKNS